jgi:hypothetical protein
MAATIPGHINYTVPPVAATASSNEVALAITNWTADLGSVGFLSLAVTTDGDTAFIREVGASHTSAPADPIISAELDSANAINRVARIGPIRRSEATGYELYTSGASTAVLYQWLPVTEWGD